MSNHNYINPAFCQQSELDAVAAAAPQNGAFKARGLNVVGGVQRTELTRSYNRITSRHLVRQHSFACSEGGHRGGPPPALPPKLPVNTRLLDRYSNVAATGGGGGGGGPPQNVPYGSVSSVVASQRRYALVPVEEIPFGETGRYAVVNGQTRSQDFLNRYASSKELGTRHGDDDDDDDDIGEADDHMNLSDQFCSLPPLATSHSTTVDPNQSHRIKSAFSSDFGSKSFILYDQKSNQRYDIVPTEEDEELVDDNHEIIQMHNGRAHRYAVIPADDEETCLDGGDNESDDLTLQPQPMFNNTPPKVKQQQQQQHQNATTTSTTTPKKNPLATQLLHELLTSTPQKPFGSTPRNSPRAGTPGSKGPDYGGIRVASTPKKMAAMVPGPTVRQQVRANEYNEPHPHQHHPMMGPPLPPPPPPPPSSMAGIMMDEALVAAGSRTTAIISPRRTVLVTADKHATTSTNNNKSWDSSPTDGTSFQKMANASATVGAISLMLILCGFMNTGLSLYMTAKVGREFYLDVGILAGFAAIAFGILGFKSRQCDWLPNRNYMSGFVLVTIFSLLNSCADVMLMTVHPHPGTPLHDVTTGIILGQSFLILLLISLGVVTSRWCRSAPPDNRVDVF